VKRMNAEAGETVEVSLWYPKSEGPPTYVVIGLDHTRAADNIRVSYDFERDGYRIEMPTKHEWAIGEPVDECWIEVAFLPSSYEQIVRETKIAALKEQAKAIQRAQGDTRNWEGANRLDAQLSAKLDEIAKLMAEDA
jgi:hypothetical protein